ncbi:MAG: hypothetical protein JWR61_5641 [Ferruginibacter sp.]|uniref:hypothetical protein n=1 Tax=Ferruginibacter sp. TaxID=1940288 RepID=UPI00265AF032|nr:hypothetical protein [Ferruginibacter sp.]MDB5280686.1 hypothetical protein [Ferruginibacter sp.]
MGKHHFIATIVDFQFHPKEIAVQSVLWLQLNVHLDENIFISTYGTEEQLRKQFSDKLVSDVSRWDFPYCMGRRCVISKSGQEYHFEYFI